jgi:hypothetical protein
MKQEGMLKSTLKRLGKAGMLRFRFLLFLFGIGFGQFNRLGINPDNDPPHSSAILDVDVGTGPAKGVLIPRLTTSQRNSLAAVEGLLIFNIQDNALEYYDGTRWVQINSLPVTGALPPSGTNGGYGVAISTTGAPPHDAALLDVSGDSGGVLLPRLTESQRDAISSPAEGLLIYNTTTRRLNYYDGSGWKVLCGTPDPLSFIGSITASDGVCVSTSGNARTPVAILEIEGTQGGFLIPRVNTAGRNAIRNPPIGLWLYNTDVHQFEICIGLVGLSLLWIQLIPC